MNGVEKVLLFLRGYPKISLTNGGIKSAIYVGTIPLFTLCIKYNFCWCLLTDRLVQPHSLYNLTNDTDQASPVTIQAVTFCIFCKVLESCCVQPSITNDAYSLMGSRCYK